jgi:hypothetical protein
MLATLQAFQNRYRATRAKRFDSGEPV